MQRHTTCLLALIFVACISTSSLAEQMSYGSRAGMTVTVLSKMGIGTENAVITVEHRLEDAKAFCVEYVLDDSKECVSRTMVDVKVEPQVFANCLTKTWTDFGGERFALLGEKLPPDPYARFDIRRLSTGEVLDSSAMASGYGTALGIFQQLCPGVADNSPPVTGADEEPLGEGRINTSREIENIERYYAGMGEAALLQAQVLLAAQGSYLGTIDGRWGPQTKSAFDDALQAYLAIGGRGDDWGINQPDQTPRFLNWVATAMAAEANGTDFPD